MPAKRVRATSSKPKKTKSKKKSVHKSAVHKITAQSKTAALAAARMGVWEWNIQSDSLVWSEYTYIHFGFSKPYPRMTLELYRSRVYPDDVPLLQDRIRQAIEMKQVYHIEHRIIRPDGKIVWLEAAGNLLYKNGKPYKLAGTTWDVTDLKKSKSRLQSLDQLFTALSMSIHELFLNNSWDKALTIGLQKIGEATQVDRVYLFQNDANTGEESTSQRFEWNSGIAEPQIDNPALQNLPASMMKPAWLVLSHNTPFFQLVNEIRDDTFRQILQDENILSILLFPIFVRNKFWGFIGFDECKFERQWTEVEFSVLRSFATSIASALERKLSEIEKEDWKIRYELISASSGQVIYDYNISTDKIIWGGNIAEVLGYTANEMGDLSLWGDRMYPDDRERAFELLDVAQRTLQRYEVEYRFMHKQGNYVHMYDRGFFLTNDDGKAVRMLGMMTDVTERKQAEVALRESEQRFRSLQKASFGGIGIHDKGKLIECNQGLTDITGYSREELIGMNGLLLVAEEYREMVLANIVSGYEKAYDLEGLRKDGSKYFLEVRGKNIPYLGKEMRVTEFRDISDRKKAEQEVIEQNARLTAIAENLKRKNEQLEEFTQIVSHNLRSPVGNILTLLEFYETTNNEEEKKEYVQLLKESGKKTLTTLHDLHEVLSIQQNKNIAREEVDFANVFNAVETMLQAKIIQVKASITTDFSQAPFVLYPPVYLESILLNLVSNALKYSDLQRDCRIEIRTTVENGQIALICTDNGLGIDLERYKHQIFKMRKVFHPNPESRGIGLFLIKNQIETMGGEITVKSEPGVGSTFTVIFNKFAPTNE